jgi:hypothetical protein
MTAAQACFFFAFGFFPALSAIFLAGLPCARSLG